MKKQKKLNKRNLEGYYLDGFMKVVNLKIIVLMHFSHKLFSTHDKKLFIHKFSLDWDRRIVLVSL